MLKKDFKDALWMDFEGFEQEEALGIAPTISSAAAGATADDDDESDFEGFEPDAVAPAGSSGAQAKDGLIADIFGASDDEDDFEGFAEAEVNDNRVKLSSEKDEAQESKADEEGL